MTMGSYYISCYSNAQTLNLVQRLHGYTYQKLIFIYKVEHTKHYDRLTMPPNALTQCVNLHFEHTISLIK